MQKYCCDGFTEEYHKTLPATPFPPEAAAELKEYMQAKSITTLQDAMDALDETVLIIFEGLRSKGLNDASDVFYGHIEGSLIGMLKSGNQELSDWVCPYDDCECDKRIAEMQS
jgi:hypothetical protein